MTSLWFDADEKRWVPEGGGALFSVNGMVFVVNHQEGSQLGCGVLLRLTPSGESVVLTQVPSSSILEALQAAHLPYEQDNYGLTLMPATLLEAVRRLSPREGFAKTLVRRESDELRLLDCATLP